jgi:quinol monooxygenase YgiN
VGTSKSDRNPSRLILKVGRQGANDMYGLIVKLTTAPGKREEMIRILRQSAVDMPGCFSYVVAKDSAEEDVLWVTEVWDS